jgi:hypothetical protein
MFAHRGWRGKRFRHKETARWTEVVHAAGLRS